MSVSATVVSALMRLEPPLEPSADEARNLLQSELSNPIYQPASEPWYLRILNRIMEFLDSLAGTRMSTGTLLWIFLAVVVFLVVVFIVAGPIRRARKTRKDNTLFSVDVITASEYRERAQRAAALGNFSQAAVELYRACVRRAEETVVISEHPGRTAHEAATSISTAIPSLESDVLWAAAIFDLVEYGDGSATAQDVARLEDLYTQLEHSSRTSSEVTLEVVGS